MKENGKQALRLLALCAVAAVVGVAAGALAAVFGRGLLALGAVRAGVWVWWWMLPTMKGRPSRDG